MNNQPVIHYKFGKYLKVFIPQESRKTIFYSVLWLIFGFIFWWHEVGNPFDEYQLITNSRTANGFIIDTQEDEVEDDEGQSRWYHSYYYEFQTPDGNTFKETKEFRGQIEDELEGIKKPYPIKVEYLLKNPSINRMKGNGNTTVFEWLWRKIGLGSLFLFMILSPGIFAIKKEFLNIKKNSKRVIS
jgi:hypothetical protein